MKVKHSGNAHKCKCCQNKHSSVVQRWYIAQDEYAEKSHKAVTLCAFCAYKHNAVTLDKNGTVKEYARNVYEGLYWNLPVENRRVYCILFEMIDGFEDSQDYDVSNIVEARTWKEIAERELLSSGDHIVRIDVYDVPEHLRDLYGYELSLDDLGECMYTARRSDIVESI